MVDLGPLDPESLRAAFEAAKLGKELFADSSSSKNQPTDDPEADASDTAGQQTSTGPSDVNNPTIGPGGIIGNVSVTNIYFDTSGQKLDMTATTCCYDYPEGMCPHRRRTDPD